MGIINASFLHSTLGLNEEAIKVLSIAMWMIAWWISDAIPMGIVAFFPLLFFPILKIIPLKEIASFYAHPIIYLFMGGFMMAIALEKTLLSKRIALNILKLTGSSVKGVVKGFIIATALLSMWISNTATTVMMIPIAESVYQFIRENSRAEEKHYHAFATSLFLCIAYAANIGGIATPIGTPPNVVLLGLLDSFSLKIEFIQWVIIASPVALCVLYLMYQLINKFLFPYQIEIHNELTEHIQEKLTELGPLNREQKLTLSIFAVTCLAWIFKSPLNYLLGAQYLDDSLTAMIGGCLMFAIPVSLSEKKYILDKYDIRKIPWEIVILFGGGLSLAHGMSQTGIVHLITDALNSFGFESLFIITALLTTTSLFLTEVMSNVALCNIALPVILAYGQTLAINPLLFGIPVTIASSFAFSMPISTPPNAIVFSSGKILMKDMFRAGIILNILSIITIMSVGWLSLKFFI